MKIVNIPIEPVRGRYSEDWANWFSEELTARKYDFATISGPPLRTEIKDGAFLDVVATTHYKAHQIQQIAMAVDSGFIPRNERVVFLVHDGWFPIEQLAYMRDMLGCYDWRFLGIFHAGTYDRWDQTAQHGMYTWGEDIENGWFKIYDTIVVASQFHKDLLLKTRKVTCPIHIIPWKVDVPTDIVWTNKSNIVVFPHRRDVEKQFAEWLRLEVPSNWTKEFTAMYKSKNKYYEMLGKSKIAVSFALQETFGIAMVESVLLGCIPLVPDRLSYQRMYPRCFRYRGESELKAKVHAFCNGDVPLKQLEFIRDKFTANSKSFFDTLEDAIQNL